MSVTSFIPTLWSARLLAHLDKALVFGGPGVVNRDYEGEIRQQGDTVTIGQIGDITVKAFTRNVDIDAPEELTVTDQLLEITEADYFNFQLDDADAAQVARGLALVDQATQRAAYALADAADQFIAAQMLADGTALTTSETDAYEQLVDCKTQLDEANVPTGNRWAIVPPSFDGLLLKDDRFVASGAGPDAGTLANGEIGRAAGFRLFMSNNTGNTVFAGSPIATSYAEQISKVEAFRMERRFADAVKGLHLYGAKVTIPTAVVYLALGS